MNLRGSLTLLILQTLTDKPYHGYHIVQQIKQLSQGVLSFKEGTIYPTLHSMEQDGLLESYIEEEQGRSRRYYRLTQKGSKRLAQERKEWEMYVAAVSKVLKENL